MLNSDIFRSALAMLAESMIDGDNEDYEERAPYLIASFCNDAKDADAALRRALYEAAQSEFNPVFLSLDSEFPLLSRFVSAAVLYLAAMLALEYDSSISDSLYDKYSDCISRIYSGIPSLIESVADRYFFT